MSISTILLSVFIAFAFVGWGIIGKYSQANGGWVGTIAMGVSAVAVLICSVSTKQLQGGVTARAVVLLLIAGALNGFAMWLFANKVTHPATSAAAFIVLVSVLMAAAAPILDWFINNTTPDTNQTVGYALAITAIYFLSK